MDVKEIIHEMMRRFCNVNDISCTECIFNYDLDGNPCDHRIVAREIYAKVPNVFFEKMREADVNLSDIINLISKGIW